MRNVLSENILRLAGNCRFPLYVVGGRTRDFLAGLKTGSPDTDLCAPVAAEKFIESAKASGFKIDAVYKNTGTVKFSCLAESASERGAENGVENNVENYEFASFRSDEYVRGEHRPANTFFTDDITLDARRRDFKCNAVYYSIKENKFIDPLGGITDIKNRVLSTVASAEKVFGEDGLRLMRLARIAAETGFAPDAECMRGAKINARLITDVAPERVWAELDRILHADSKYGRERAAYEGLCILRDSGVLEVILPELYAGNGMKQREDIHRYDVLEHSLRTVMYSDGKIRLAALMHDIGKPYCMQSFGNYYNHEVVGAEIAESVMTRLKVPKKQIETCVKLTALHMYDFRCDARENKVRKFIVKNYKYFDELMLLKQADFSACRDDLSCAPSVVKMTDILNKMKKEGVPLDLKHMNVRGGELIEAGCPKALAGKTLEKLLYACAIRQVKNEREELLRFANKNLFV